MPQGLTTVEDSSTHLCLGATMAGGTPLLHAQQHDSSCLNPVTSLCSLCHSLVFHPPFPLSPPFPPQLSPHVHSLFFSPLCLPVFI